MCMGGSGGGSEQQQLGSWSPEIGPYWHKYLSGQSPDGTHNSLNAEALAHQPYQQYSGQRIAPMHASQNKGLYSINKMADEGGTALSRSADDQAITTLQG